MKRFIQLLLTTSLCGCVLTLQGGRTTTTSPALTTTTIPLSMDTPTIVQSTSTATNSPLSIHPQGTVIYTDFYNIYAVDLQKEDFKIFESIPNGGYSYDNVVANDSYIYFRYVQIAPNDHISTDIYRLRLDGSGLEQMTSKQPVYTFTLTPDSGYLIYDTAFEVSNRLNLNVLTLNGGGLSVVRPNTTGDIPFMTLSPDRKKVAFFTPGNSSENGLLFIQKLPGGQPVQVANEGNFLLDQPAWSPDGKYIALGIVSSDQRSGIFLLDTETNQGNLLTFTEFFPSHFVWSPDGKKILFEMNNRSWIKNQINLCMLDIDTKQTIIIQNGGIDGSDNDYTYFWSPDGMDAAYFTLPNGYGNTGDEYLQLNIYEVNSGGRYQLKVPGGYIKLYGSGSWISAAVQLLQSGVKYIISPAGNNSELHSQPSSSGDVVRILHAGEKVTIVGGPQIFNSDIWRQFRTEDGVEGWGIEMPDWYMPVTK